MLISVHKTEVRHGMKITVVVDRRYWTYYASFHSFAAPCHVLSLSTHLAVLEVPVWKASVLNYCPRNRCAERSR